MKHGGAGLESTSSAEKTAVACDEAGAPEVRCGILRFFRQSAAGILEILHDQVIDRIASGALLLILTGL